MLKNLIGADWVAVDRDSLPVYNPASGAVVEQVPISGAEEVQAAVSAATGAFATWSRTPLLERVRLTFRFKELLERDFENLARIVTLHHGKTLDESRGEVRRGIEVVDFACGAPTLLQGRTLRSVSAGVDQDLYRYPVGVCCGIPPFNFPVMIPLWMYPLAVVAGNTFILKPSEKTPMGATRLAELFLEAGFPGGVLNLVHGSKDAVDALIEHPDVSAVSFVGSEPVARHVYLEAARNGKRVQALGGAKNHMIVMPDAEVPESVAQLMNAGFGNAGERCLAGSVAVVVGKTADKFVDELARRTNELVVGPGDQPNVDVGPLIRAEHRKRVLGYIDQGAAEGATVLVDGRTHANGPGFFLGPTILDRVTPSMTVGKEEIFGPVLSVSRASSLDDALAITNSMELGNMAVIFTQSGKTAREFRERVQAGMVGINVPIAQPFAFFPFSGWKRSFYGDLHMHGTDGIDFFTRKKTVISRW